LAESYESSKVESWKWESSKPIKVENEPKVKNRSKLKVGNAKVKNRVFPSFQTNRYMAGAGFQSRIKLTLRVLFGYQLPHRAHPRRPSAAGVVPLPLAPD